jgi:hypothetical protein
LTEAARGAESVATLFHEHDNGAAIIAGALAVLADVSYRG